ncbi:MAG: Hint domain-containing protein [Silicimonas sp.]|nr:Hint domain-containing protein [Silicimonas sp.]
MPATYTDQFYSLDPANPPASGSAVSASNFDLVDQNDDNDIDSFDNDNVDGQDVTRSWPGDTVTINVPGVGNVTYTGTTFYLADGRQVFTPTDGQVLQAGTFVSSTFVTTEGPLIVGNLGPPCFTPGTLIRTPGGAVPVERLRVGDLVETLDHGAQELRWVGRSPVAGVGRFAPVEIAPGVLGNRRRLLLSQQHRVMVSGWACELLFSRPQLLVAAVHLTGHPGIRLAPTGKLDYFHLMCAGHEILWAEDAPCESFLPANRHAETDRALASELQALFPERPTRGPAARAARPVLKRHEAEALVRAWAGQSDMRNASA